jgi:intracellular multiplication protein IcmO
MSNKHRVLNKPFQFAKLFRGALEAQIGGPRETLGILSLMGSAASLSPFVYHSIPLAMLLPGTFALAAIGGSILADSLMEEWKKHFILDNTVKIESSRPPEINDGQSGLCMGYTTDKASPFVLSNEMQPYHCLIEGQTGVGKSVAGSLMMAQQIQRGGGVLWVDGKLDVDNINAIYQYCVWAGRAQDFYVVNPGDPTHSNTYNPILDGDPDEVASRILSMIPSTESNAGSDHYKQSALEALMVIIGSIQKCGMKYDFYDLTVLLNSPRALEELLERLRTTAPKSNEFRNLLIFLDRYRFPGNDPRNPLSGQVDTKRLKDVLGGIAGRLFTFGTGNFGQVLNDYNPDVNIYKAIKEGKIVYVALPTMGKEISAFNFGKLILGDLRTAIAWLQADRAARPKHPFLAFFDEAASYFSEAMAVVFEQARSANIFLMPAIQTDSGFDAISEDFKERVIANTTTKMFFRMGSSKSAEMAAELIGMTRAGTASTSESSGSSSSAQYVQVSPQKTASDTTSGGSTEKEEERYLVSPDQLKSLKIGEAVISYEGNKIYNILVPLVKLDQTTIKSIGDLRLNFRRKRSVPRIKQGLDMMSSAHRYLQNSRTQVEADEIRVQKETQKKSGDQQKGPKDFPSARSQSAEIESTDFYVGENFPK